MVGAALQGDDPEGLGARWNAVTERPLGRDAAGRPVIALDDATLRFAPARDGRGEGLAGLDPRFPDRLPGGSSSGSVSAVAAGLADFALGTDTSGSIRVPASYCGVYGFRRPRTERSRWTAWCRSPRASTPWVAGPRRPHPRTQRAGAARCAGGRGAPRQRRRLQAALPSPGRLRDGRRHLGELGDAVASMRAAFAESRDVRLVGAGLRAWFEVFHALKQWEAWQAHGEWIRAVNPRLADNIRANFEAASPVTEAERRRALGERERLRDTLHLPRR